MEKEQNMTPQELEAQADALLAAAETGARKPAKKSAVKAPVEAPAPVETMVLGEDGLGLETAPIGGVAHEVGTLRMAGDGTGVVDADLKFLAYDNLYACDNSVFPASPAANPSLTTAALALRLARHLTA